MDEEEIIADFKKILKKQLSNYDGNKRELIDDIFKYGIAELWRLMQKRQNLDKRLEYNTLAESKRIMIRAFLEADLGDYQKNESYYSELFDSTAKDILETAASNHKGNDTISMDQSVLQ